MLDEEDADETSTRWRVRSWRFRGTKRTNATLFVPQFQNQIATNYTEPNGSFHAAVLIAHLSVLNFQTWSRIHYYDLAVSAAVPSSSTLFDGVFKRNSSWHFGSYCSG